MGRGGRFLLRSAAAPGRQRHAAQGRSMVGLLPLCATTVVEQWQRERVRRRRCHRGPLAPDARTVETMHPTGPGHFGVASEESSRCSIRSGSAGFSRRCSTRTSSSAPTASARSPSSTSSTRMSSTSRPGVPGGLPAGRIEHRHVRRQLQLARPDLDAGETMIIRALHELLPVLRRQFQNRMPHRVWQDDEPLRGRARRSPTG